MKRNPIMKTNNLFFFLLRYSGLPAIIRNLKQKKKVTILLFHDPSPTAFEKTVSYLKKNYNIISLNSAIEAIQKKGIQHLPKKSMVLTFDDGHIGNFDLLPIVKKYKVPITIFICSGIVNTKRHFWFKEKVQAIHKINLKRMRNKERLNILRDAHFNQEKEFKNAQALNNNQIQKMIPHVSIQGHTVFHPILPTCEESEAKLEISESKTFIENTFNIKVNSIAYPNGDYCNRDIQLVKNAGYEAGLTVDYGFNDNSTDLYRMKRISVNDTENQNELIVKASGLWGFLKTRNGKKQKHGYLNKYYD
jgi:peptidoglycan/xylan/chitin deacetylase (PgdA/CDA1 family)